MKKIVILSFVFWYVFTFCGCSSYSYDDLLEAGGREYEKGYEDGYNEGYEQATYDYVLLIDVVNDLLDNEEYEVIEGIRKYVTDSGVFGDYVIDTSTNIIHDINSDCFSDIPYEHMNPTSNLNLAIEKGCTACGLCIY